MRYPYVLCLVCGLLIGGACGWYAHGDHADAASVEESRADLTPVAIQGPSGEMLALLSRNKLLEARIAELESERAAVEKTEKPGLTFSPEEKGRIVEERLGEYRALFDLSPEQARKIGELEWQATLFWKEFFAGIRTAKDKPPVIEDEIRALLSPEQLELYEQHLEAKSHAAAELSAQSFLSRYPVTLNLSEDQKDAIFVKLYSMHHKGESEQYQESVNAYIGQGYDRASAVLLVAADGTLDGQQVQELTRTLSPSK